MLVGRARTAARWRPRSPPRPDRACARSGTPCRSAWICSIGLARRVGTAARRGGRPGPRSSAFGLVHHPGPDVRRPRVQVGRRTPVRRAVVEDVRPLRAVRRRPRRKYACRMSCPPTTNAAGASRSRPANWGRAVTRPVVGVEPAGQGGEPEGGRAADAAARTDQPQADAPLAMSAVSVRRRRGRRGGARAVCGRTVGILRPARVGQGAGRRFGSRCELSVRHVPTTAGRSRLSRSADRANSRAPRQPTRPPEHRHARPARPSGRPFNCSLAQRRARRPAPATPARTGTSHTSRESRREPVTTGRRRRRAAPTRRRACAATPSSDRNTATGNITAGRPAGPPRQTTTRPPASRGREPNDAPAGQRAQRHRRRRQARQEQRARTPAGCACSTARRRTRRSRGASRRTPATPPAARAN